MTMIIRRRRILIIPVPVLIIISSRQLPVIKIGLFIIFIAQNVIKYQISQNHGFLALNYETDKSDIKSYIFCCKITIS